MTETKAVKSEQTRRLIVETALRLFRERGYEATTMRAIATEAGVSVGNAYYYFASKEALIQAYYDRAQAEHAGRRGGRWPPSAPSRRGCAACCRSGYTLGAVPRVRR